MTRYRCVEDQKAAGFPVAMACEMADVSTSGFYDWTKRCTAGPTDSEIAEAELVEMMRDLFAEADGNYGVYRMWRDLRDGGLIINSRARWVRDPGPPATRVRAGSAECCLGARHHLHRHRGGLALLGSVLDLGSRRMLGYSMADHMRTELVLDALTMAVAARGGDDRVAGIIGHADRGAKYTSKDDLEYLRVRQMCPSVGRTRGLLG